MDQAAKERLLKMLDADVDSERPNVSITITRNEFRVAVIELAANMTMKENKDNFMDGLVAGIAMVAMGVQLADILFKNAKDTTGEPKA